MYRFVTELAFGQRFYLTPKAREIGSYLTYHETIEIAPRANEVIVLVEEGILVDGVTNFRIICNRFLEVELIVMDYDDVETDALIRLLDNARDAGMWEAVRDLAVLLMIRKDKEKKEVRLPEWGYGPRKPYLLHHQVKEIKEALANGTGKIHPLAKEYDVLPQTIRNIRDGRSHTYAVLEDGDK